MKSIIIEVNGTIRIASLTTLEDWQKAVGGYVEAFGIGHCTALVNEEGKILNLPFNRAATELCARLGVGLADADCICGVMLIVGPPDDAGEPTDVTASMLTAIEMADGAP